MPRGNGTQTAHIAAVVTNLTTKFQSSASSAQEGVRRRRAEEEHALPVKA